MSLKSTTLAAAPLLFVSATALAQEPEWQPESADEPSQVAPAPPAGDWPWRPERAHFVLKVSGGPTYRNLYGSEFGSADLAIGVGADTRRLSAFFVVSGLVGQTQFGLDARQLAAGGQLEFPINRVRLGFGLRSGYFAVDRVTTSKPFELISVGAVGSASVDLVQTGTYALALGVTPTAELLMPGFLSGDEAKGTGLFGVGARLEIRWRAPREGDPVTARARTGGTSAW